LDAEMFKRLLVHRVLIRFPLAELELLNMLPFSKRTLDMADNFDSISEISLADSVKDALDLEHKDTLKISVTPIVTFFEEAQELNLFKSRGNYSKIQNFSLETNIFNPLEEITEMSCFGYVNAISSFIVKQANGKETHLGFTPARFDGKFSICLLIFL
jgi:hypothetical protein